MKITRWPICWAVIWGIFAALSALGGAWYEAWVALIFCLVNVREFYTQQQINGLRALLAHEEDRANCFEMAFEEKREICAEWRAEALRLGSELEKF